MAELDWRSLFGNSIEGKYHLTEFIDAGSYGGVFRADEVVGDRLMRSVAIKLLQPATGDNPYRVQVAREKQLTELQYAAGLDHPHVIRCHSVGQWDSPLGPLLYIVMELAELSLETVLANGPLEPAQAADMLRQMATALEYLHDNARGLVHRDIKPANILQCHGQWKLSDLGTAVALGGTHSTQGAAFGTAEYAPPESYDGVITRGWDIWSLGVVLVESLSLELPFSGEGERGLMRSVHYDMPHMPLSVREPFATIARQCLRRDSERRITAAEILRELTQFNADGLQVTERDFADNPFEIEEDGAAMAELEQLIRAALADRLISSPERVELNEAARRLRIPLATARSLFNRIRAQLEDQPVDAPPPASNVAPPSTREPQLLNVGGGSNYPTISAAIRNATPGSTIHIAPGSYNEQLQLDREITLVGEGGPGQVRIVSRDRHTVLCKTARAVLRNLELICRVSNSEVRAAALCLPFGRCVVRDCIITSEGDVCVTAFGRSSNPQLADCSLSGGRNACLSISHHATVSLRDCTVSGSGFAGVYTGAGSKVLMQHCTVRGIRGSGLLFHEDGAGELSGSLVADCLEHGVLLGGSGSPVFSGCEIRQNHGWGIAGGRRSQAQFIDCEVHVNGAGSREHPDAPVLLENSRLD
ncbi:MAG: protein kinase [Planctomycetales bacterium]|nr:MAG: protein kinase [Planctomycetales bacterium]